MRSKDEDEDEDEVRDEVEGEFMFSGCVQRCDVPLNMRRSCVPLAEDRRHSAPLGRLIPSQLVTPVRPCP